MRVSGWSHRDTNIVHVGNPHGRIAVWLDEGEAIEMAEHYGRGDSFHHDLMLAVEKAYPETAPEEVQEGEK